MEDELYRKFYEVETRHWWFVARQRIIEDLIVRKAGIERGSRVLDIGCGTGAVLASFSQRYEAYGTDTSPLAIEFCRKRGLQNAYEGTLSSLPHPELKFDLVLLLDVIEHIDDDVAMLKDASNVLKPGGLALITVPAYQFLWSRHDTLNFHKRRYVKSQLRQVVEQAGLKIEFATYFNTFLFPLALVGRLFEKLFQGTTDRTLDLPPKPVNALLTATFSFEKNFIGNIPLPFGLSIIAMARKR
ncbi:MAG TPA: class I SAM-dependent methyltransferase [Bacteroidota bacterium]